MKSNELLFSLSTFSFFLSYFARSFLSYLFYLSTFSFILSYFARSFLSYLFYLHLLRNIVESEGKLNVVSASTLATNLKCNPPVSTYIQLLDIDVNPDEISKYTSKVGSHSLKSMHDRTYIRDANGYTTLVARTQHETEDLKSVGVYITNELLLNGIDVNSPPEAKELVIAATPASVLHLCPGPDERTVIEAVMKNNGRRKLDRRKSEQFREKRVVSQKEEFELIETKDE